MLCVKNNKRDLSPEARAKMASGGRNAMRSRWGDSPRETLQVRINRDLLRNRFGDVSGSDARRLIEEMLQR